MNLYVYFACRLYSARERWETVTAKSRQYSKLRYYTPRKSFDKRGFVDLSQVFLFSPAKAERSPIWDHGSLPLRPAGFAMRSPGCA